MLMVDMTTADADEGRYVDGVGRCGNRQRGDVGVQITQDR